MRKIRVVHFCTHLGLGGTEKTARLFCRELDRSRFEVFAVARRYHPNPVDYRKARLMALFGSRRYRDKLDGWACNNAQIEPMREAVGTDHLLIEDSWEALRPRLWALQPDILHVHYSGDVIAPVDDDALLASIPVTVTTNVFWKQNTSPAHNRVARMLFVSAHLRDVLSPWARGDARAKVLYNPIDPPKAQGNLRRELGIPENAYVIGRVGRPANSIHHPISIQAYRQMQADNTWFLALAAPPKMRDEARKLGVKHFVALPPTADELWLSRFYNTIDVLAHARADGETFGVNIAESMTHGHPVVSHRSPIANAQEEIIGDTGFITGENDIESYAGHLRALRDEPALRAELGRRAKARVASLFDTKVVTRQLEQHYEELWAVRAGSAARS